MNEENLILLISCPDKNGLVARISNFIFEGGGNIINLDQHVDSEDEMFFMRLEWSNLNSKLKLSDWSKLFYPMGREFKAKWTIENSGKTHPMKIAIMVSKYSHCLLDLLWRKEVGELQAEISMVISNHTELEHIVKQHKIEFHHIPITKTNKKEQEAKEIELLQSKGIDLIVLARYMQILSGDFVKDFPNRIINIHHSFLPAFVGGNPYKQAQDRGVKIVGATSHYVTSDLDQGPIIAQDIVRISHRDSLDDLVCKGREIERNVFSRAIKLHLEHRILVHNNKTIVFEK
jgi:formyltetrahydrofolate deformylase